MDELEFEELLETLKEWKGIKANLHDLEMEEATKWSRRAMYKWLREGEQSQRENRGLTSSEEKPFLDALEELTRGEESKESEMVYTKEKMAVLLNSIDRLVGQEKMGESSSKEEHLHCAHEIQRMKKKINSTNKESRKAMESSGAGFHSVTNSQATPSWSNPKRVKGAIGESIHKANSNHNEQSLLENKGKRATITSGLSNGHKDMGGESQPKRKDSTVRPLTRRELYGPAGLLVSTKHSYHKEMVD